MAHLVALLVDRVPEVGLWLLLTLCHQEVSRHTGVCVGCVKGIQLISRPGMNKWVDGRLALVLTLGCSASTSTERKSFKNAAQQSRATTDGPSGPSLSGPVYSSVTA